MRRNAKTIIIDLSKADEYETDCSRFSKYLEQGYEKVLVISSESECEMQLDEFVKQLGDSETVRFATNGNSIDIFVDSELLLSILLIFCKKD